MNQPISPVPYSVIIGSGSYIPTRRIKNEDFLDRVFFDAEGKLVIADIGHFESEQFTQHLLYEIIRKKFSNFAVRLTEINTNSVKYYI